MSAFESSLLSAQNDRMNLPTASYFALFGHPVGHSFSPRIHQHFAEQFGLSAHYDIIDAAPEQFETAFKKFAMQGGKGANITAPHKHSAFLLCQERSERAQQSGVVNTITVLSDGHLRGDNTDGVGLIRDITERHLIDIRERRTLLLGAGGAAYAVAWALLDASISELVICNRTAEHADALTDRIADPTRAHSRYWHDLPELGTFDFVINATSAGHSDAKLSLPFSLINHRSLCYDLSYSTAAQDFLAWAHAARAMYIFSGIGMLIEQAAEAFEIWHGMKPDTTIIYKQLYKELGT